MKVIEKNVSINQETYCGLSCFGVSGDAEVSLETLRSRLIFSGLDAFIPNKRNAPDALRRALSHIVYNSIKTLKSGNKEELVISYVPKKDKDGKQRWTIHIKETEPNKDEDPVMFNNVGTIELSKDGDMTVPYGVPINGDGTYLTIEYINELVEKYTNTADMSKLRGCLEDIYKSLTQIKLANGVILINETNHQFILNKVLPVFESLDKGEVTIMLMPMQFADIPKSTIKHDVQRSVSDTLKAISSAILEAQRDSSSVVNSTILDWLNDIEALRANMGVLNILGTDISYDFEDLEAKIETIKTEVANRPRKKRVISMAMPVKKSSLIPA